MRNRRLMLRPLLFLILLGLVALAGVGRVRAQTAPVAPHGATMGRLDRTTPTAVPHRVVAQRRHESPGLLSVRLGTLIFSIIVFLVLVVVLRLSAWKPILTALKNRENTIRESIEAAKRAKADAELAARDLEARIAEAQRQGALQLAQAKADALKVAESIRVKAEAEAASLKDRALKDISAAKEQALGELNTHVAGLGAAIARRILQREIGPQDQNRLMEQSLSDLQANTRN